MRQGSQAATAAGTMKVSAILRQKIVNTMKMMNATVLISKRKTETALAYNRP
jgi:hypothetical protein